MYKQTLIALAAIGLTSAASAGVIFNADVDNSSRVGNVQMTATDRVDYQTDGSIDIIMPNNQGKANNEVGLVSDDDINTLNGSALTAADTVIIKGVIDQIAPTSDTDLGNFAVVIGMNSAATFRAGDNLLYVLRGTTYSGDIAPGAFVDEGKLGTTFLTTAELVQGLTWTLTADVDGYEFLINPNATTVDAFSVSGTFAGEDDFVNNFGTGHFYLTTQRADKNYHRTDISEASISVIPEPATLGLVAAFGMGILFIRRRLMM